MGEWYHPVKSGLKFSQDSTNQLLIETDNYINLISTSPSDTLKSLSSLNRFSFVYPVLQSPLKIGIQYNDSRSQYYKKNNSILFDLNINEKYTEVYVNYNTPEILMQAGILSPDKKLKENNLSFQFELRPDDKIKFHFSLGAIPGEIHTKYEFPDISDIGKRLHSANYTQTQHTIGAQFQLFERYNFFIENIQARLSEVVSDTIPDFSDYTNNSNIKYYEFNYSPLKKIILHYSNKQNKRNDSFTVFCEDEKKCAEIYDITNEGKENNFKLIYNNKIQLRYNYKQMTSSITSRIFPSRLDLSIDDYFTVPNWISFVNADLDMIIDRNLYNIRFLLNSRKINIAINLTYMEHHYSTDIIVTPFILLGVGIANSYELDLRKTKGLNIGFDFAIQPVNNYFFEFNYSQYIPISIEFREVAPVPEPPEPVEVKEKRSLHVSYFSLRLIKKLN